MKRTIITATLMILLLTLLAACDPSASPNALVGTWVRSDGEERWIFRTDDTFDNDMYDGSTWTTFMSGTYDYNPSPATLTLTPSSSGTFSMALILNPSADRMVQGLDALSGGDASTLVGTWEGTLETTSGDTLTNTWTFTSGTPDEVSHTNSAANSGSGEVSIDTTAKEFTVSSSDNTSASVLPDGTYSYLVIGDGITIAEPTESIVYFDKQ